VERVCVIGTSGSGKTSLARRLASALGYPMLELDSVYHLPEWQPRDDESFRAIVADFIADDQWIIDGNYATTRDIVWRRADTVIWLDYSRPRTMTRVVGRTVRRLMTREVLWNGNREGLRNLVSANPENNILLWSWTTHPDRRRRYAEMVGDRQWWHITFHRLRVPSEARALMEGL
jgi:adenylate kinase family enzyme